MGAHQIVVLRVQHGHRAGVEAVRDTVEASAQLELEVLTLYAFSVENWKRPRYEVWALMNLLKEFLRSELETLVENGIRFTPLGRWRELGALLDRNHRLVSDLGVSTPALDAACQQARDAGALGAKLTGGGGGGCVLALTEDESSERVLAAWRRSGLHCFEASVPGPSPSGSGTA